MAKCNAKKLSCSDAEKASATKKYALVEFATLSDRYIYGEDVSYRSYVGDRGDYDITFLKDFCDLNEALDALYAMEDSCSWYDDGRYIVRAYGVSELDEAGLYTGDIIYG